MWKNTILRVAGAFAVLLAIFHGLQGDAMLTALKIDPPEQMAFIRATYQIGSLGWLAGGILFFVAASMKNQIARNWIVGVFAVVYGIPAASIFLVDIGVDVVGGIMLGVIVVLALIGRNVGDMVTS
ncbi:MAG: hypothetical protein AAF629_08505 [Chloroflexota bacterium]